MTEPGEDSTGRSRNAPVLGCVADDITGASDLADALVQVGLATVQVFGVPADDVVLPDCDAVVVALKSRTCPAAEAVEQSVSASVWLQARGAERIFFKYCSTFDSTPSGNIGPVADALRGPGTLLVHSPAYPVNGRTRRRSVCWPCRRCVAVPTRSLRI